MGMQHFSIFNCQRNPDEEIKELSKTIKNEN
jgi:hypothetical protein